MSTHGMFSESSPKTGPTLFWPPSKTLSNDPPEDGVPMAASWALSASICF